MRPLAMIIVLMFCSPACAQQLKEITNSIGMKLVLIHHGSFTMGSPDSEIGRQEFEIPHEVIITKSYYLGVHEVTQGQYERVMGNNPNHFKGSELPIEKVSWDDAVAFCEKLSDLADEKMSRREYRLPTEAEWEYACRASSTTSFCFGDETDLLADYAWFSTTEDGIRAVRRECQSHPVGEKKPNRWGLVDMHGNVSEWCLDFYGTFAQGSVTDPTGPIRGKYRVFRGGSWGDVAFKCRAASRNNLSSKKFHPYIGFRVAMSLQVKQPEAASAK